MNNMPSRLDTLTNEELALGLMKGDAASFKAGYSAKNAVLAVQELRGLSEPEAAALLIYVLDR
jgi:hypothetical protein